MGVETDSWAKYEVGNAGRGRGKNARETYDNRTEPPDSKL